MKTKEPLTRNTESVPKAIMKPTGIKRKQTPVKNQEGRKQIMDNNKFTWRIVNFTKLKDNKHYSEVFTLGGYKWRILIFPKGNDVDDLSMYLDVSDSERLPSGWSRRLDFTLSVMNQIDGTRTIRDETTHLFNAFESDWGFTSLMPLSDLNDPSGGYLVNDTVIVEAEVVSESVHSQGIELDMDVRIGDNETKETDSTDGLVPDSVLSQGESEKRASKQIMDNASNKFRWRIVNFTKLKTRKHYSEAFNLGGYNWRIAIYPKGRGVDGDHLSVYLEPSDSKIFPVGWTIDATFSLAVVNQIDEKDSITSETLTQFHAAACSWGYTSFMLLSKLNDPDRGYIMNDTLVVEAQIVVRKSDCANSQDKKMVKTEAVEANDKSVEICFDEIATTLLENLEDEKVPPCVKFSDFEEIASNNYVDVGVFSVPASLESYAKELLGKHPDIGTGNSVDYVNQMTFVVLCSTLKCMDTTRSDKITETLIFKWRDAIRTASQFGFKVGFLKDHLKSISQAYLAKLAKNSHESRELQRLEVEICAKRKELDSLTVQRADMYKKANTPLRKSCETTTAKFSGETYGYFAD